MEKNFALQSIASWRMFQQADADNDMGEDIEELPPRLHALAGALLNIVSGNGQFSKDEASYQDSGASGDNNCGACLFYCNGGSCCLVEGPVNATAGTCNLNIPDTGASDDDTGQMSASAALAAKMARRAGKKSPKKMPLAY